MKTDYIELYTDYLISSNGNMSKEMVEEYLEHHRTPSNKDLGNMMLE